MARKQHLINVHTSTGTTAPTGASLYLGEIAVQHTPNDPALWIKVGSSQSSEEYEKFIGETEITSLIEESKILGSGYTYSGIPYVNSATSIADAYSAITNEMLLNEEAVAAAFNDLNERVSTVSDDVTALSGDVISLSASVVSNRSNVTALSASVVDNKNSVTALSASVVTNKDNVSALSASVVTNKDNVSSLSASVVTNQSNITSLSASVVDNKNKVSAVTISLEELSGIVEDNEYVVAQAFNDVNGRLDAIEGNSGLTELSASVISNRNEISAATIGLETLSGMVESAITSIETIDEVAAAALVDLNERVSTVSGNVTVLSASVISNRDAISAATIGLDGKEDKANKVTSLSSSSTNAQYPSAKATYDNIHPAVVTSQPSGGFAPNILYNLGTISGTVTFSLASPADANIVNHYYWTFETDSTAPTITWPAAITSWLGGTPLVVANKHYEISVLNGVAVYMEV